MNEDMMLRADEKKINWYPGHMARAKRALADQLSRVDVVVELCDARIPRASRNPDLDALIKGKRRLLVLGKADLAQENQARAWLAYFRAQGIDCMSFDSIRGKAKDIIARIEKASAEAVAKMAARGVKKTVRVMIVGVPNVGIHVHQPHQRRIHRPHGRPPRRDPQQSVGAHHAVLWNCSIRPVCSGPTSATSRMPAHWRLSEPSTITSWISRCSPSA